MIPFWQKKLNELNVKEWESLCDGCGRCCLHKFQDEDTDELLFTRVGCRLLDPISCQCTSYESRLEQVADCVDIRGFSNEQYAWLPQTCAYRLRFEDKPLPQWHPLLTGSREAMRASGVSMSGEIVLESDETLDDLVAYIDESLN